MVAAWLIFNHYSVWLSSLSGLSAFLSWSTVRLAAMLLRTSVVKCSSDRILLCCISLGPSHLEDFCQCQSARPACLTASHLTPATLPGQPSPHPPHTLYRTQPAIVLLCSCVVACGVYEEVLCLLCLLWFMLLWATVQPAVVTSSIMFIGSIWTHDYFYYWYILYINKSIHYLLYKMPENGILQGI